MIDDEKFMVHAQQGEHEATVGWVPLDPREYFVLKRGDVLAISTLRSYANNAMTMMELQQAGKLELTMEEDSHLRDLAMYASELADEWEQDPNLNLPD